MDLIEKLVVFDPRAATVSQVDTRTWELEQHREGTVLADHAGSVPHGSGQQTGLLYADDLRGELVEISPWATSGPWWRPVASIAVPAEHLARSGDGTVAAVTTGVGASPEPWSDLLTVVDLTDPTGPAPRRVRLRADEPGVVLTPPTIRAPRGHVVVRHREPGHLDVHDAAVLLFAGPGCPTVTPKHRAPLPADGHGDALDPATGRVFTATGEGLHTHHLTEDGALTGTVFPWGLDGRAYYLRLDPAGTALWATVRGGPSSPTCWQDWSNHLWRLDLATGQVTTRELGPGLVFRLTTTARLVVVARCHPDGDEVLAAQRDNLAAPLTRVRLPAMEGAARPGHEPWGAERRALAGSPSTDRVAVSRGGHGQVHVLDAEGAPEFERTLRLPGPLSTGGHLAWLGPDPLLEAVGR